MVAGIANAQKPFRKFQIGAESSYGVEVAATRLLRILTPTWEDLGASELYTPNYDIGRMSKNSDVATPTRTGLTGRIETDFSFEDVLLALKAGFMAATGSEKTVGQADYEYLFKLDPNAGDPTPTSFTAEFRLGDGTTNWDRTATGLLVPQIEISAGIDGDVTKLQYEFFTRAPNSNALAALTPPAAFTTLPVLNWKFYINDTWAAMDVLGAAPSYGGGAQVSTTVRSFTWRYQGGISPALYIGAGQLDPQGFKFSKRGPELELELEWNATLNTERTKAEASPSAKRYIRLLGEGARIGTGYNKTCLLQAAYIYPKGGFGPLGRDADGTEVVTLRLEGVADDDTEDTEVRIINTLSAFP